MSENGQELKQVELPFSITVRDLARLILILRPLSLRRWGMKRFLPRSKKKMKLKK